MDGFNFTKKFFGEIVPTVSSNILDAAKSGVRNFVSQTPKEKASTITKGIAGIGTKVLPTIATETLAGLETFGKTVLEGVYGKERVQKRGTPLQDFYGRETISLQEMHRRSDTFVGNLGGNKVERLAYPVVGSLGYAAIESPIGLPSKNIKVPKALVNQFVKNTDKNAIETLIKTNFPLYKENSAKRLATKLSTATNENEVLRAFGGRPQIIKDDTIEPDLGKSTKIGEVDEVATQQSVNKYNISQDFSSAPKTSSAFSDKTFGHNITKGLKGVKEDFNHLGLGKKDNWKSFPEWRDTISDAYVKAREWAQDDWFRMKKISKEQNLDLKDVNNPYLYETLYHGRVGAKLEDFKDFADSYFKELDTTAKELKLQSDNLAEEVSDYMYTKHAIERNDVLGDGAAGISTKNARKRVAELESKEYFESIQRLSDEMLDVNRETLDILRTGGVIDDTLYKTLTEKYQNHVPLYRIMDDEGADLSGLASKSFDVKTSGIRRAKGSTREVADIYANIISNFENAVVRSEKNIVGQSILKFARQNKGLDIFEEVKLKPVGKNFQEEIILENPIKLTKDPQILTVFENGKPTYLRIKDKSMATMFKGIGREKLSGFLRISSVLSRLFGGLQTRFNPAFALPNKIRDVQEVLVYLDAETRGRVKAANVLKYQGKAEMAVKDFIIGKRDSKLSKLYAEMRREGGTTGGFGLQSKADIELNWKKSLSQSRSDPRGFALKALKVVDNINQVFEDSTRLSVYAAAKDSGMSVKEAAFLAKNASVNFNKMGTAGPAINAMYVFSNAGIQGTAKTLRAMKNPKTAAKVVITVGAATYALNEYNNRIDPDWRGKVTKWDRLNGLTVLVPTDSGVKYITLPVGWGLKPIKAVMDSAFDLSDKSTTLTNASSNVITSIIESYNPVGGSDLFSALSPTFLGPIPFDTLGEIYRNRAWHGGKIAPDWDPNMPDSLRFFPDLEDTTTGKTSIAVANGLSGLGIEISPQNLNYALETIYGGAGRFGADVVELFADIARGDEIKGKDLPIASRFIREKTEEEVGRGTHDHQQLESFLQEQSREKATLANQAEKTKKQLDAMGKSEAKTRFDELINSDPALAKKIASLYQEEQLGLTFTQRKIKNLNVNNGARAKYLAGVFNKLPSKQEKENLWNEYVSKKIITPKVAQQLVELLKEQNN